MVRNLLYSICLHLIFILFIIFSGKINNILNDKVVNINGLNIESDFLEKNNIKVTDKNIYSNLTLNEKIELYELSKEGYDKNKKFTEFSANLLKKKLKAYEKIENIPDENNTSSVNVKFKANEVLYLGPTDYNKLLTKLEEKRKEREKEREKKEQLKKEEENKKEMELIEKVEIIKKEDYDKVAKKSDFKSNIQEKLESKKNKKVKDKELKENTKNIEIKKPVKVIDSKEPIQFAENINDNDLKESIKNVEDVKNGNITNIETSAKKTKLVDKRITEILDKNLNSDNNKIEEQMEVKKEEDEMAEQFNIDIDKIFTKNDLRDIKKYLKEEGLAALTLREKVNIQNQIIMCYKNAILQTKKNSKVRVSVTLKLFQDGIIDTKKINIKIIDDKNKFNESDYKDAIENVKLALAYCNPLRNLPLTKYQNWQHINFIFDATTINQ